MARPSSDIDPRKLDVVKRKRRRKDRSKPDPKPFLKDGEAAATERAMARPASPAVMLEPRGEGWKVTSPHSDGNLWELQLADAFGTRSHTVMTVFLRDLRKLCRKDYDFDLQRWKRDETELNAALAMVNDWRPENTAQASLAAQMVATHWMVMRLSAQALNNGHMVMEKDAALASKLSRTFAAQCETMMLLQGRKLPSRQTIRVEKTLRQEVHYHDHRRGAVEETDGQCDAKPIDGGELENETTGRIADLREVPGDDEGRKIVPLASRRG